MLGVVGDGERTLTAIGHEADGLQQASLSRALPLLVDKRVVVADQPLSARSGAKDKRYQVADPYLRFWLTFLGGRIAEVERGRGTRCSPASARRGRHGAVERWNRSCEARSTARDSTRSTHTS